MIILKYLGLGKGKAVTKVPLPVVFVSIGVGALVGYVITNGLVGVIAGAFIVSLVVDVAYGLTKNSRNSIPSE